MKMKITVTGAFGYSGKYIARRLLDAGHEVSTLTNSFRRENPFEGKVQALPFHFDQPSLLAESLRGVAVLINTYWVRFDHRRFTHHEAVENTKILFDAAKKAGVQRIVHVSITNPDITSSLPYFRGKAELEEYLPTLGVSHCILRPTVLFGKEDVLINNIAWALRHLPFYGLFGKGDYRLQPIYVDDLAAAAVAAASGKANEIINAIGLETFTYRELVATVARSLGLSRLLVPLPPELAYWACRLVGLLMRDVVVTREEIRGLMENRLFVAAPPLGATRLSHWIAQNQESLGRTYTSELARRVDRLASYD
jgi:NADH dehydrogenase